jgi:hypothetical protein
VRKLHLLFAIPVILALIAAQSASSLRNPPNCHWDSSLHKVVCVISGGEDGDGGDGNPGDEDGGGTGTSVATTPDPTSGDEETHDCNPGTRENVELFYQAPNWPAADIVTTEAKMFISQQPNDQCFMWLIQRDACIGHIYLATVTSTWRSCGGTEEPPVVKPPDDCDLQVSWTGSGFLGSCINHTNWECVASIPLPPTYIDVRPFPVTLVRWPTAIRYSGQDTSQGSCSVATAGKLRNLTLTLDFKPATGIVTVSLPYLPPMTFTSPSFMPTLFKWEVPSHQAVGGGRLSGTIPGFDEVPGDIPAFEGHMKTPYRLYYTFSYDYPGGTWAESGELLPQDIVNLPPSMIADLNSDGVGDAYWDPNFVISRMDDNNRTDNPLYARHWSWGETIYWLCREGQGQIGWPR